MLACPARVATASAAFLLSFATAARSQTVAITGATAIDGTGRAPIADAVVLIRDGRIAALGSSREVTIPSGATRIDGRGKYLIPGLMDANLHLYLNGDIESLIKYEDRYDEVVLESARSYRRINAVIKDGKVVDLTKLPVAPIIRKVKVVQ